MIFKYTKGIILGLLLLSVQSYATLSLDNYSFGGLIPTFNVQSSIVVSNKVTFVAPTLNVLFVSTVVVTSNVQSTQNNQLVLNPIVSDLGKGEFTGLLLNYPNPFSMQSGTTVGYSLTKDMAIEFRIYALTGYLVFRKEFAAGELGGMGSYNRIPVNLSVLGGNWLSPGVYIYALFSEGKLIARSRMVVKP